MNLLILAPICSILALVFAGYLASKVLKEDEGTDQMKKIAGDIRKGADAYLKRQYTGVAFFFVAMFIILGILVGFGFLTPFVPFAFISGGFFSGLSGSVSYTHL